MILQRMSVFSLFFDFDAMYIRALGFTQVESWVQCYITCYNKKRTWTRHNSSEMHEHVPSILIQLEQCACPKRPRWAHITIWMDAMQRQYGKLGIKIKLQANISKNQKSLSPNRSYWYHKTINTPRVPVKLWWILLPWREVSDNNSTKSKQKSLERLRGERIKGVWIQRSWCESLSD